MAETDVSQEFGREPGFSRSVFALTVLICYTRRSYWDVNWMLYHRKTQNSQNCFKIVQIVLNFKIRVYFQFMGLGRFSECGLVFCLLWLRNDINFITIYTIINHPVNRPHHLWVPSESRLREWCVIIGLPVPWVCLLCQHASVPVCQRVIPEVSVLPWTFPGGSSSPRCPEGQVIVPLCQMAQNSQDCTYGSDLVVMMTLVCFSLSCDGLLAVFVTINC